MSTKLFSLIQHKLIPAALFAGNLALVHLIYLLENGGQVYALSLITLSLIMLISGIFRTNKYLLSTGIVFYALFLFFCLR